MKGTSLDKIAFLFSFVVLAFLYGYGTTTFGWFPRGHLDDAVKQAHRFASPPEYLWPSVHDRAGVRAVDAGSMQPGLTLLVTWSNEAGWRPVMELIDQEGRTLHEWHVDPDQFLEAGASRTAGYPVGDISERALHGVQLLPGGDVVANLDYVGTVRLDACSRVQWLLPSGNHHSIARADDGSFWIPASSPVTRTASPAHPDGIPGLRQPVYMDWMLRVSPEGAVLDSLHVLDLLYRNNLQRHIFKAALTDTSDITHLNDIEPLSQSLASDFPDFETGDVLLSLRNLDLVLVVDPHTRQVKWHESHPFLMQHDPDFLEDGWIGVFDNNSDGSLRGEILGGSRIVAVQPHTDSVKKLFPTSRSDPFHTHMMGKWQRLKNGNLLLTEARVGRVVEVAPDGRTVWEWVAERHGESLVAEVTEGTRYDLTREDVASWPCSGGAVRD